MLSGPYLIRTQAVVEMVHQLRSAQGKRNGLILANGGVASYENTVCLSNIPRQGGLPYPRDNVVLETPAELPCPPFDKQAEGPATIEVGVSCRQYRDAYVHSVNNF